MTPASTPESASAAITRKAEPAIPYKIAVLVYVFNSAGKLLLLHRKKPPNKDLYSPIGGKLEQHLGESPHTCALREIEEEIGERLTLDDIRLLGIVSERAYAASDRQTGTPLGTTPAAAPRETPAHWLMFCFETTRPLDFPPRDMEEGRLEWIDPLIVPELSIPKTDREIIWPLIREHSRQLRPVPHNHQHESVFCVHIDCTDTDNFIVTLEHPRHGNHPTLADTPK